MLIPNKVKSALLILLLTVVTGGAFVAPPPIASASERAVTITVTHANQPLADAFVQVDGVRKLTGANGSVTFSVSAEPFNYSIVKNGSYHVVGVSELKETNELKVQVDEIVFWEQHVVNDRSARITYLPASPRTTRSGQEGWIHANLGGQQVNKSYDSDNHRTTMPGATATLEFIGSQIKLFVQGVAQGGLASVRIDDGRPEVVDTKSATRLDYMLVFEKYNLRPGAHTLEITALGVGKSGSSGRWWLQLDFLDTSDLPVMSPFTPDDIKTDFTSLTPQARIASFGKVGKAGLQDAGFVFAEQSMPTIQDLRISARLNADNTFSASLTDLHQATQYHVRPYIVLDQKVYYGRDSVQTTKSQIVPSENLVGLVVGDTKNVTLKTLFPPVTGVTWSVFSENRYDGSVQDVVDISTDAYPGGISIVGKAEGEAVIRAVAKDNPSIYTDIQVTVARKEKYNLAATPPMGWNSWNSFGRLIDSETIKDTIDNMTAPVTAEGKSLKDLGYEYLVVDGGWRQDWLEPDGSIVPNSYFGGSQGMKDLVDYAHSKGLKFGLHVLPGVKDCADQYVGAKGNERLHLAQYRQWGIDFLKQDKCGGYGDTQTVESMYKRMKYYMDNAGRDFLYSISNYVYADWEPKISHMWRTTGDIWTVVNHGGATFANFTSNADKNSMSWAAASPSGWNDPDIMVVGDPGLTATEWVTNFNMWAMMAAPLMLGFDLASLKENPDVLNIISNAEVIAIDQDRLGKQGRLVKKTSGYEIWAKPLVDGSMAVMLLNDTGQTSDITVNWSDVVYDASHQLTAGTYQVLDLWAHTNLDASVNSYTAKQVPAHGTVMLKVTP